MLQFIVEKIDPLLVITGINIEEEFMLTLQFLGYPYSVMKSCLKSVVSPHSWQFLIGVLIWIIDLCMPECLVHVCVHVCHLSNDPHR